MWVIEAKDHNVLRRVVSLTLREKPHHTLFDAYGS